MLDALKFKSHMYKFYDFDHQDDKYSFWECKTCSKIIKQRKPSNTNLRFHLETK